MYRHIFMLASEGWHCATTGCFMLATMQYCHLSFRIVDRREPHDSRSCIAAGLGRAAESIELRECAEVLPSAKRRRCFDLTLGAKIELDVEVRHGVDSVTGKDTAKVGKACKQVRGSP